MPWTIAKKWTFLGLDDDEASIIVVLYSNAEELFISRIKEF